MKKTLAKIWAKLHTLQSKNWKNNAVKNQEELLISLLRNAKNTKFGVTHQFHKIQNYSQYKSAVPVQDYEGFKPYVEAILQGQKSILWNGKPLYFAKTSGTTSGTKYIPISYESMPYHINAARSCLFHYIAETNNADFVNGKMIFVQGSPELQEKSGIKIGRLSGIVAHYLPKYLQKNRLPSWETNCIEDWETKINKIVDETINQNMTLISGIPPWLIMYFEKLKEKSGQNIGTLFPNLQLLVTGGVNYEPYRIKINDLIGRKIDILQTFPASEGFFAFQDHTEANDLLLLTNHGIFYEFIPLNKYGKPNAERISLKNVKLNTDYALIITTNAGLWSYDIGDVVRFTSLFPHRIIVSGRTKHFTSAFGEHVIASEVEQAMQQTLEKIHAKIIDFTLAPQVNPENNELPYHEWFIEFEKSPENLVHFAQELDEKLRLKNTYYNDLIIGKVLQPLKIKELQRNAFAEYMKITGKTDPQSKAPRLSNNREMVEVLERFLK